MSLPPLLDLADALAAGRTTSRALIETSLARIEAADGEGARAFVKVYADAARAAADGVDRCRAAGLPMPRYAGIPVSIKDLFDVSGEVTLAGSRALADAPPATADAPAVARLRAAGMIVIGRTNMTEFAYSGVGLNPHYGTPLNPFDRATGRIPGGSSSGAVISVTDGMAAAGLGTDTGGSCRIPAALTGTVGFKPTAARVPLDGVVPLSGSLDSVGSIARTVACCAIIDAIVAGEPPRIPEPFPLRGLRLAVPRTLVLDDVDSTVNLAFQSALGTLVAAGARVAELPLRELGELPAINAKGGFAAAEAYAWHRGLMAEQGDLYDQRVRVRIEKGAAQSAADYLDLCRARRDLCGRVRRRLSVFDAMILPTVPLIAPTFAELAADDDYGRINLLMLRNPAVINFLDGCAASIPCHAAGEAPVGLMVAGQHGEDHRILAIARAIAAVTAPAAG